MQKNQAVLQYREQSVNDLWSSDELEELNGCPICAGHGRRLWFDDLRDWTFGFAPGLWELWRCLDCHASYLNPRPDKDSIARAYGAYYTHTEAPSKHFLVPGDQSDQWIKRAFRASYYRWRFGHRLKPYAPLGWIFVAVSARRRVRADQAIRHLRAPQSSGSLLDVGCGNGSFLRVASVLGYSSSGIELDVDAAATAMEAGFSVSVCAVEQAPLEPNSLDQITLNHVIEHLHDPLASMKRLIGALRPGGRIWLQTPNTDGLGAVRFGRAWRGLEAPRHLVLFNPQSLQSLLDRAGFTNVTMLAPQQDASFYLEQSQAIAEGRDPYARAEKNRRRTARKLGRAWNRIAERDWGRAESITMIGFKPGWQ